MWGIKHTLVAAVFLILGFLIAGNTDVVTRTFFPEEKMIAQISLSGKSEEAAEKKKTVSSEEFSKTKTCSFINSISPIDLTGPIIFNEVAWMGGKEDFSNEWIELKNIGGRAVDISGWQVLDKDEQIKIIFSANEIDSGEFLVLRRDEDFSGNLRNSEEGLRLFDDECNLIDEVLAAPDWPAGDNKNKFTMERAGKDFSWYTASVAGGTPDKENSAPSSGSVSQEVKTSEVESNVSEVELPKSEAVGILISEIMVGTAENSKYEFVELYNPGSLAVDMTGWNIKKRSSTGSESSFVVASRLEGKTIGANRYFLIVNPVGWPGTPSPDLEWPASYALAYAENGLYLYKSDGTVADSVFWTEIPKGSSLERSSWEENRFEVQSAPTPRSSK
ncbi:MAG: lamin tail domain-containing protein [Candidatus Jorgensenbacteria bacterium]